MPRFDRQPPEMSKVFTHTDPHNARYVPPGRRTNTWLFSGEPVSNTNGECHALNHC